MKITRLAVFGHYDSRGGTMAVPLTIEAADETKLKDGARCVNCGFQKHETTMQRDRCGKCNMSDIWAIPYAASIQEAKRVYNLQFGIDDDNPSDPTTTAYGMPMRECDRAAHELMYGFTKPADEDFMYVAELHHADDVAVEGELDMDYNGDEMAVLINEATVLDNPASTDGPVQLELVVINQGTRDLKELHEKLYMVRRAEFNNKHNITPGHLWSSDWTAEARADERKLSEYEREFEIEFETVVAALATQPGMKVKDGGWGDDAFGFYVLQLIAGLPIESMSDETKCAKCQAESVSDEGRLCPECEQGEAEARGEDR